VTKIAYFTSLIFAAHIPYACSKSNENVLDAVPGPECSSDPDCAANPNGNRVCALPTMTCVQCTVDKVDACTEAQVCDSETNLCRACAAHGECDSQVCLPDGKCALESEVAYVNSAGTDNDTCNKAMQCTKISKAMATNRSIVKLKGNFDEAVTIDGKSVKWFADPETSLRRSTAGNVLTISGATVEISDLTIGDASVATNGTGIFLSGQGAAVSLRRSNIKKCVDGIRGIVGSNVTVTDSLISSNSGVGISVSGTSSIVNSTISLNQGGGLNIIGIFTIVNNFVFRNGSTTSTFGGVNIIHPNDPAGVRFEYNTVVSNQSEPGRVAGMVCSTFQATSDMKLTNSIIAGNNSSVQISGTCMSESSKIQPTLAGLEFVSSTAAPFNFRLKPGSIAIGAATTPTAVTTDFEGDPRTNGAADQGADELP
jgi:hypothetical protein